MEIMNMNRKKASTADEPEEITDATASEVDDRASTGHFGTATEGAHVKAKEEIENPKEEKSEAESKPGPQMEAIGIKSPESQKEEKK